MPKIKYYMVHDGGLDPFLDILKEDVYVPGLINWPRVFQGGIVKFEELSKREVEEADILHVNLTGKDKLVPLSIRECLGDSSSTKLVVNLDYSIEYFQAAFPDPVMFFKALASADLIFATEPYQQRALQYIVDHHFEKPRCKKVPLIPHPCPVSQLNKMKIENSRMDIIAVHMHRYCKQVYISAMLSQTLPNTMSCLVGYLPDKAPYPAGGFDMVLEDRPWKKYIQFLRHCKYGLLYTNIHSLGRFVMECACLGIPCVSTNTVYATRICFPELTFSPLELEDMRKALERLVTDIEFYERVKDKGCKRVEFFNYKISKERFLKELERCG